MAGSGVPPCPAAPAQALQHQGEASSMVHYPARLPLSRRTISKGFLRGSFRSPSTPRKTKVRPGSVSLRIPFWITAARKPRPAVLWPRMARRTSEDPRWGNELPKNWANSSIPRAKCGSALGGPHIRRKVQSPDGRKLIVGGVEKPPGSGQGRRTCAEGPWAGGPTAAVPRGSDPPGCLGRRRSAARRSPRGFKPPPPEGAQPIGSSITTVTSPGPERQLLGGALRPPRLPRSSDPTNSTSDQTPTRVLPPAPRTRKSPSRTGPTPPDQAAPREFEGRDGAARGDGGGGQNLRPSESVPGRGAATTSASPVGHGRAPTHPPRALAGRARTRASLLPRPSSYPSFRLAL